MFTNEELTGKAVGFFLRDQDLEFIFATEDGNFFLPHSEKHARNHTVKPRVKMLKIERPVKEATPKKRNKKTTKTNK